MNPALHYKIYRDKIDKEIIIKYIKYSKFCYLYNLAENYVWGVKLKSRNKRKAFIIKVN